MNESLQIDPSQLDEEWLQQPLLFSSAVTEAADCQKAVDDLKDEKEGLKTKLEWLVADRSNYLRKDFLNHDFTKAPAQGVVDDWVNKQVEVSTAKDELHEKQKEITEAVHAMLLANGAVKALETKKAALENLCKLHGMNYFAVPNPGHMLDGGKRVLEAQNQKVEEQSTKATEALNKRKVERKTEPKEEPAAEPRKRRPRRG